MRVRSSVSNLPFGASVSADDLSKAHQAHVSSLSRQAFACIRPVMRDGRRRHSPVVPVSCCLSATGIRFLGLPAPAAGFHLSHDRPTLHHERCQDLDGVSMFRTNEIRVGSGAPFTPGLRCSHSRRKRISCRCRSSATSPALRSFSCLPELRVTKPHQGFTLVHPSTLPLACDPRTRQGPLGFSPRLRTPQLPVTHARAGTGIEHLPELRSRPISTSHPRNPLVSCDLMSHVLCTVVQVLRLAVLD
jgi:hypothetical protein